MLERCERGLFIVPVGELEGFVQTVGNKGPKWVNTVLRQKSLATSPELQVARTFAQKLIEWERPAKSGS